MLAAVQFAGGPGTEQLLQAVSMLAELYATGARKVPAGAAVGFVPTKWAGFLVAAEQTGDVTAYRRYWELAVLVGLRDGLRSGDVFVPGSRRYADPASFLLTRRRGLRRGWSFATWSASRLRRPTRARRPRTSCTPPLPTWRPSSRRATRARSG